MKYYQKKLFYILFNINYNLKNEKDEKKLSSEILKNVKDIITDDFKYEKWYSLKYINQT